MIECKWSFVCPSCCPFEYVTTRVLLLIFSSNGVPCEISVLPCCLWSGAGRKYIFNTFRLTWTCHKIEKLSDNLVPIFGSWIWQLQLSLCLKALIFLQSLIGYVRGDKNTPRHYALPAGLNTSVDNVITKVVKMRNELLSFLCAIHTYLLWVFLKKYIIKFIWTVLKQRNIKTKHYWNNESTLWKPLSSMSVPVIQVVPRGGVWDNRFRT